MDNNFKSWVAINLIDKDSEEHIRDIVNLLKSKELTQRQADLVLAGVKVLLKESKV